MRYCCLGCCALNAGRPGRASGSGGRPREPPKNGCGYSKSGGAGRPSTSPPLPSVLVLGEEYNKAPTSCQSTRVLGLRPGSAFSLTSQLGQSTAEAIQLCQDEYGGPGSVAPIVLPHEAAVLASWPGGGRDHARWLPWANADAADNMTHPIPHWGSCRLAAMRGQLEDHKESCSLHFTSAADGSVSSAADFASPYMSFGGCRRGGRGTPRGLSHFCCWRWASDVNDAAAHISGATG